LEDLFLDSGIFIKLFDCLNTSGRKSSHEEVLELYHQLRNGYNFITTNIVICESFNFISNLIFKSSNLYSVDDLITFNSTFIESDVSIFYLDDEKFYNRALEIIENFQQYKFNYIDAISLSFIEEMGGFITFTLDDSWKNFTFLKGYTPTQIEVIEFK